MGNRKYLLWVILALLLPILSACATESAEEPTEPLVIWLQADGPVSSAMADYLNRGLDRAVEENAEAVVFQLNTPGGSVAIMNRMVQEMRNSEIPILVYVAPRGAMAASAGTLLTLAGHKSAMAPETTIGAASPVDFQGQDIEETQEQKTKEILRATIRSLTEDRPADAVQLAEQTIESATAVSATEALQIGLIDFIAQDITDLLKQADGSVVRLPEEVRRLETANAQVQEVEASVVDTLLNFLTNPNVVFLLLNIGVLAILVEISTPGGWLPGFIGVVCLVLATYGLGVLPVNWFGLVFIALAFVLFVLELKTAASGALIAVGIGSFIAGSLILFNSVRPPEFQPISIPLIVFSALASGLLFAGLVFFALKAQSTPIQAGHESLVGKIGVTRTELNPRGQFQVGGELWTAELLPGEPSAKRGERLLIVSVDGLRLRVRRP